MDDSDKLMNLVQKMSKAQLRQVTRFAEFILLEDEPDDLNDRGDVRTRYAAFKDALRIDPAAIDAWVKSSGQK
jgi:DNA polymerase IIIc chi subunit